MAKILFQLLLGCSQILLVDKLSVKAPDGPTKNKILKEIATEHNVTWEPEYLVEPDPKETVLMVKWSKFLSVREWNKLIFFKNPNNQPPEFQAPSTANVEQNLYETDGISSSRTASTDHYRQDPRPSEFADATTAAHAAAELSSKERMRMTMQSSTESPNSSSYDNIRNEPSHRHSSLNVQSGENASWKRGYSRDNSLEMRQSDSFAKVGRAKQQPIKDDVNDSCSEDVQLKKQSSLPSSSSHTSYVSDDNNIIFEDKRFQSTVEDTERKSHGHDVAPVMVTADKSILSVFVLCCLSRLFMDWV
ncbi:hypothetical protein Bca4012_045939 [Brassica carinata]